jgi:dihydrofolate synthase/folylpolyglutamate synthase
MGASSPNRVNQLAFRSLSTDVGNAPGRFMIDSLENHLQALYRLRRFGIQLGLAPMSRLLRGLGQPHLAYSCIHVAGTNGKGSVAAMIASVLSQAGYGVGLYTSPHLVRFNERIRVNGVPISDKDVIEAAESVGRVYTQSDPPTFFECATAMAFYHFKRKAVEWAVLETGMGGRYDATNVIHPRVCAISNIGMEHTEYLGKRLVDIAAEKAGIIKPGAGIVTGVRQKQALAVIERKAAEKNAPVRRLGKEIRVRNRRDGTFDYQGVAKRWKQLQLGLPGSHQKLNAGLALGTLEFLQEKGLNLSDQAIFTGLRTVSWPGRLEIVCNAPLIILDGAHNPSAVAVLERFLRSQIDSRRLTMIIGILRDKAWKRMLRRLASVARRIILTQPQYERAGDAEEQSEFVKRLIDNVTVKPRVSDAISFATQRMSANDALCITGSLYTVGEAKAYLEHTPSPWRTAP